jgi:hypothetical protein
MTTVAAKGSEIYAGKRVNALEAIIEERIESLRGRAFTDLVSLPECTTEIVNVDDKDVKVTTFHEILEDGKHRIVVQGIRERWAGITAKVLAMGFEFVKDGVRRTLTPEDLYDFT